MYYPSLSAKWWSGDVTEFLSAESRLSDSDGPGPERWRLCIFTCEYMKDQCEDLQKLS